MEVEKPKAQVRIVPKKIPNVEKKILCSTFLDAVIKFYDNKNNDIAFRKWLAGKGESKYGKRNS